MFRLGPLRARIDGGFVLEKIKITSSDFAGQLELEADLERSSGALHFHPGTVVNQELVRRNWKSISRESLGRASSERGFPRRKFLTDHGEINLKVFRRRVLEVDPAPIDPLVVQLNRVEGERGRLGDRLEVSPRPDRVAVRRVQGFVERPAPHVEAGNSTFQR